MTKQLNLKRITRVILFFGLTILTMSLFSTEESRADTADYDPWYYVSDRSYRFRVPDKFQHFWGSAALTELLGPMPALALGITKEIYDDKTARVGFSSRDIVADVLGIMSTKLAQTEKVNMWLDWQPDDGVLILRFGIRI
jgi:uncharacterized protein YfiM (DUF2279 family)